MNIMIRIQDEQSFIDILRKLKANGMLKEFPSRFSINDDMFPLDIPFDVEMLIGMAKTPLVKGKVDQILTACLMQAL